ncbi:MAG TPA: hypothetical protein VLE91_01765 [Candidatus Saccharimonadales bacterium]|nr:hypothetical protein [Candidatus Saccharimonadales bacterium]
MRDLSRVPLGARSKKGAKVGKFIKRLRLLVIVVVIIAAVLFVKEKFNGQSAIDGQSIILREASHGLTPVKLGNESSTLLKNAVDLKTEKTTLKDVKYGGSGVAVATAARSYGGGSYILTVDATLPDPVNVSYEVWVVGGGEVVPVDFMQGSGTHWTLNVNTKDEFSNYSGIWITLERLKDEKPEEHVLEGTF